MSPPPKKALTAGTLVFAGAGFAIKLTASDARDWLSLASEFYAPLLVLLMLALGWYFYRAIDEQHRECREELRKLREAVWPVMSTFTRATDGIPPREAFIAGDYDAHALSQALSARRALPRPGTRKQNRRSGDRRQLE